MPRRIEPAPAASSDDEMEMRDLVIDVKPEPDPRPLQAPGLGPFTPKEVPAPERFESEPRHCAGPVPIGGLIHALGLRNQWTPLSLSPHGERPLPQPRANLPPFSLGWDLLGARTPAPLPPPTPGPCLNFLARSWPPTCLLTFGFPLSLGTPRPHPGPTPRSPPASSLQTASRGPTNTQIC